ncbi:MAG: amidohydrolase family protein [Cyclobacteriaceae bacterium]|nr:amidohydrolase family protein [Cyclobacteriaceae bacterium]
MRIDAHQHFWKYSPLTHPWISTQMGVIKRDFFPEDLAPLLKENGFEGCVAVQADQSERETDFLLDLAGKHDFIKGVVGWVDLRAGNTRERLEHYRAFDKLKGFRHVVQDEQDNHFIERENFISGVRILRDFDLTYDILIYPRHLGPTKKFLEALPDQKFVIDHIAKPFIKNGILEPWEEEIRALARFPNVYCKVSGMVTEAEWKAWTQDDFKKYMDVVFDAFGTDRLMFGSDWPVCLLSATYKEVVGIVEEYCEGFSAAEKEKLFEKNCKRFYDL